MKHFLILVGVIFQIVSGNAQSFSGYRLTFVDKGSQTIDDVKLSEKSLERRANQGIELSYSDIPIYSKYIETVDSLNIQIVRKSKWLNSIYIKVNQEGLDKLNEFSFVKSLSPIETYLSSTDAQNQIHKSEKYAVIPNVDYGRAKPQIEQIDGTALHNLGFEGQGMTIAVFDAGFNAVDKHPGFSIAWKRNQITAGPDFVRGNGKTVNFKYSSHGQSVLSTMLANQPGLYVGTAPKANYVLLRTEDGDTETLIEEYNWLMAAEYADSIGVDMINSSLGYTRFDDTLQNHTYQDLDGDKTIITQAADLAAEKGILVVNSAGNSGTSDWYYIGAPADADSILSVGAVDRLGNIANFSSRGPTIDGRVKPNVVAHGQGVYVSKNPKGYNPSNGTSFSGPVICGMTACLWQYLKNIDPTTSNMEVIKLVEESSHLYPSFDEGYGYGIPNYKSIITDTNPNPLEDYEIGIFPNPFLNQLKVYANFIAKDQVDLISVTGQIIKSISIESKTLFISFETDQLPRGLYFVRVKNNGETNLYKVVK